MQNTKTYTGPDITLEEIETLLRDGSHIVSYRKIVMDQDVSCSKCGLFINGSCTWNVKDLIRLSRATLSSRYTMEMVENKDYDGVGCPTWVPNTALVNELKVRARLMGKIIDPRSLDGVIIYQNSSG